jgi:hypothetical protein
MLALFSGAVQDRANRPRHSGSRLKQERRLADSRLAPNQHERSRDDAAAEDAIELPDTGGQPGVLLEIDLGVQPR